MPAVSVIMPVYNVERYLAAALDSLLSQTFQDFEAVCVNNASTDQSLSILKDYALKDKRIKVLEQNNRGVSAARNAGLDAARGEYVAFLDSDDVMHPRFLETMLNGLRQNGADIVYCDVFRFNDGETITFKEPDGEARPVAAPLENFIFNKKDNAGAALWNKVYRKELFADVRLPEEIDVAEDFVVTHKLLYSAKKVVHVPSALSCYRIRRNSLIRRELKVDDINNGVNAVRLVLEYFKDKDLPRKTRRKLEYRLMKMLCKDCIVTPYRHYKKTENTSSSGTRTTLCFAN